MLTVIFQIFDFLVKAIVEFAQTEQGRAEFDDIQRALIELGVPLDADDISSGRAEQSDFFDEVDWLAQLNGLTPEEQYNVIEAMKRGGGVTPAVEVDERLMPQEMRAVKDPARFTKGR